MNGNLRTIFSRLGTRAAKGKRIVVGLKSDNHSREMLLRLLNLVALKGDSVLAVHVQLTDDDYLDLNTFHMHEDLCKSKEVEFEVKICTGSCYITELSHQVRTTFATVLAVGCSGDRPRDSTRGKFLKLLPPTCELVIVDDGGKIVLQEKGTSQQGSNCRARPALQSSLSDQSSSSTQPRKTIVRKSLSMPSPSSTSSSTTSQQSETAKSSKFSHRLAVLEKKAHDRHFTVEQLSQVTRNFCPDMLIREDARSRVYKCVLENGQPAAVKVLKSSQYCEEVFFREAEMLSSLRHENVVGFVGFCCCNETYAVVYNMFSSSLKQSLNQLKWSERMRVAIGVAKALEYIHSRYPPVVHKDVNSSHILLSEDGKPQLSDFGAAIVHLSTHRSFAHEKLTHVTGTLGYLAPEYIMYGKVDEKIDVYSYGVVLLELITGKKAAIQTSSPPNQESLVVWARSLLTCGLEERLIDPDLNEDYNKDEMRTLIIAARLCLLHSSSRRPTMKTILRFLEDPNTMLDMQKTREDLNEIGHEDENFDRDSNSSANSDLSHVDDS